MFSSEARCRYCKNQLTDVICQFRFPEILSINAAPPAEFQEAVRQQFPRYHLRQDIPAPKITGIPGHFALENQPRTTNYQFTSADGFCRINLTSKFISVSCAHYRCWEDFAEVMDSVLAAFIRVYRPAYFERIGLRYLNVFSRADLGLEATPFSELITPCYLGPMADADVNELGVARCTLDLEMALRGGCRVKLHAGPGRIKRAGKDDPELKFIFDQDLFMPGQIPVNLSAGALQTLHAQAYTVFRGAITDTLHEAMEPEQL